MTLFISNVAAKAACDAITALVDGSTGTATGRVKIYSGTVPADADAALSGNTVLADLAAANPAFAASADISPGARATANAVSDDTSADATGTATFFRAFNRAGTCVMQGSVTATGGGGQMEINSTSIIVATTVKITSWTFTIPES